MVRATAVLTSLVLALLAAPALGATTRFVAPAGSGTTCTETSPCDIVTGINATATRSAATSSAIRAASRARTR